MQDLIDLEKPITGDTSLNSISEQIQAAREANDIEGIDRLLKDMEELFPQKIPD